MPYYTVKYRAATYSGKRRVQADDEDHAIAKVKKEIRSQMSLPIALFVGIEIGYELGRCKPKRIENTHTIARPQIRTT